MICRLSASLIHITSEEFPGVLNRIANVLTDQGKLLMIVRDGEGGRETWPEIDGRKLRRIIHLYSRAVLERLATAASFQLLKEGYLAPEVYDVGWRCYIWKRG